MKNYIQPGLALCPARKIVEERGKEINGVCKGAIVIIMHGIQASKEKVGTWCGREIVGVEVLEV